MIKTITKENMEEMKKRIEFSKNMNLIDANGG